MALRLRMLTALAGNGAYTHIWKVINAYNSSHKDLTCQLTSVANCECVCMHGQAMHTCAHTHKHLSLTTQVNKGNSKLGMVILPSTLGPCPLPVALKVEIQVF